MACRSCEPDQNKYLSIGTIRANSQVAHNDAFQIIIPIKNNDLFIKRYARVCLYEGANVLLSSGSVKISQKNTVDFVFNGVMPNRSLELKASVVAESFGFVEVCQDSKYISIALVPPGGTTPPPEPPTDPTPPGEDDDGWDWPDIPGIPGGGDNIVTTIMDNIVIILILAIVLILILKFA